MFNPFEFVESARARREALDIQRQQAESQSQLGALGALLRQSEARERGTLAREGLAANQQFRGAQMQAQAQARQQMIEAAERRQQAQIQAQRDAMTARGNVPRRAYDPARGVVVDVNTGTATPVTDPSGNPLGAKVSEKALPPSMANKYLENIQNLRKAEDAAALLEGQDVGAAKGDKDATGNKGLLTNFGVIGDKILNAADPKGVDARAAIGDLGSMVIHDRSGAAVTAAEFPRLRPFIPLASDAPDVARKKVRRFAQEYQAEIDAQREMFTGSGYKVPEISQRRRATDKANPGIDALLEKYK